MGLFTDLFSTDAADKAAADKIASVNTGITQANGALDTGLATANPLYGQAYSDFSTLGGKFGKGQDAYNDATGVNGADGLARAKATYTSIPGYSGGLNTGIDAVNRGAAARGDLGGGNTSADTIKFASDYDAQKYGNYLSALAPNLAGATSATSGGAGVLNNQAGAQLGVAGTKANIAYGGNSAIGDAQAQADLAPYTASQNFWSALTGGAQMALKASGMGGYGAPMKAA
jgi:hypothetical protein